MSTTNTSCERMSYENAVAAYVDWANSNGLTHEQPSASCSECFQDKWWLENVNGPIAVVGPDGAVQSIEEAFCDLIVETAKLCGEVDMDEMMSRVAANPELAEAVEQVQSFIEAVLSAEAVNQ